MSEFKDKIIQLRLDGKNYKEICEELGCAKSTVSYYCQLNKIGNNIGKTRKLTQEEKDSLQSIYDRLKSVKKVSLETGFSSSTILKYITVHKKIGKISASESVVSWRKRQKVLLVEYKGGKCEICGYSKCISALHFHHRDPNEKDFSISGKSLSFKNLKDEVDKCVLVCANCHSEIHEKLDEVK